MTWRGRGVAQGSTTTAPRWNFVQVMPADQWWGGGMLAREVSPRMDTVDAWLDSYDAAHELADGTLP